MTRIAPYLHAVAAVAWLGLAGLTASKGQMLGAALAVAVAVGFGSQAVPAVRANRRLAVALQLVGIAGLLAWTAIALRR